MKKSILLTGGSGFIGRNIIEQLGDKYTIFAPKRSELNIIDKNNVDEYLSDKKFDVVIHCAILTPGRKEQDKEEDILDYTMRGLLNLKAYEDKFEKIIYIGSGAEFDKSEDIISVSEDDIGLKIPKDSYGYAKYILNQIARNSKNIYNLRIFGCYGPYEQERRLIKSVITYCLNNEQVILNANCRFSYVFVRDLIKVIDKVIQSTPKFHDYNISDGNIYEIKDIAKTIMKKLGNDIEMKISNSKYNNEYSCSNKRLINEFPDIKFTDIVNGIDMEIESIKINKKLV